MTHAVPALQVASATLPTALNGIVVSAGSGRFAGSPAGVAEGGVQKTFFGIASDGPRELQHCSETQIMACHLSQPTHPPAARRKGQRVTGL